MYRALVEKDGSFEGIFIVGVKTTGIFCRPTCTARKPKPENVEYFPHTADALRKGYRPCKVCKPMQAAGEAPEWLRNLQQDLLAHPEMKIRDRDLRQRGLDPDTVRRWFQKHHGITFQAWQRMLRINLAFKLLKNGSTVTHAAADSGFDSLSGFQDRFRSIFGVAPSAHKQQTMIDLTRIETPLGTMIACATEQGICMLEFSDRKALETELKDISRYVNGTVVQGENRHFDLLRKELAAYFEGTLKVFTVPLHYPGTEFQQKVWTELLNIPYGTTRSYKSQAKAIGNLPGIRAVASANGKNRISILIPCHRVIGEDGSLTGYGGGLHRKKWLLEHEKKDQMLNFNG